MASETSPADALENLIVVSRKKPVNFAVCLGKTPAATVILLDRRKPAKVLERQAKKQGETQKLLAGTLETNGREMQFTCLEDPPKGCARRIKLYLKSLGLKMAIVIMGQEGDIIDSETEEDDGDGQAPTGHPATGPEFEASAEPGEDKAAKTWRETSALVKEAVKAAAAGGIPSNLADAWKKANSLAQEGKYPQAIKLAQAMLKSLSGSQHLQSQDTKTDKGGASDVVKGLLQTLPADIAALAAKDADISGKLKKALLKGIALAKSGDLAEASEHLLKVSEALARALAALRQADAKKAVPEGTVRAQVREIELAQAAWQTSRLASVQGLEKLSQLLSREDDPELVQISKLITALRNDVPDRIRTNLSALNDAINGSDEAATAAVKKDTLSSIDHAVAFLKDNQAALKRCEANPFDCPVEIIKPLGMAVRSARQAIANV